MSTRTYVILGGGAAVAFAVFVILAQVQVVHVPYFTPTILSINGLERNYRVGQNVTFTVTATGYGSNCHTLEAQLLDRDGGRASYYKKADDCRFMAITHGSYNFTRSFEYGPVILAKQGPYKLDIHFEDPVDGNKASKTRTFDVVTE